MGMPPRKRPHPANMVVMIAKPKEQRNQIRIFICVTSCPFGVAAPGGFLFLAVYALVYEIEDCVDTGEHCKGCDGDKDIL